MENSAKLLMDSSENFESNSNKFETKFSKIPKSFSIESLIAKRSNQVRDVDGDEEIAPMQPDETNEVNLFANGYPLLPFSNFPLYNPWVGYLSQTAATAPNLFSNGQQPLQSQHNDKLAQFLDTTALINNECKDKISELLFNPLSTLSSAGNGTGSGGGGTSNVHPSNFLQQQLPQPSHQEQFLLNNKFKDNYFLTDFYNNYFLSENNKYLLSGRANGINNNNNGPNSVNFKQKFRKNSGNSGSTNNKKMISDEFSANSDCVQDQKDIDVDGDSCDGTNNSLNDDCDENVQNHVDESHDGSCSDLSMTLSPNGINSSKLDRGEFLMIHFVINKINI